MSDDKSMDDVLASIRRIVRTDRPDAAAGKPPESDDESAHGGRERFVETDAEEPLILTPEMRVDLGAAPNAGPNAGPDAGLRAGAGQGRGGRAAGEDSAEALPDREALRAMLRDLLREELGPVLSGALAEARPAEAVREIVRDELVHGETGDNVSQNVLRLIRDEVSRALDQR